MKTALFITDCSAASAETLTGWLTTSPVPVSLTVVHPYDISPGQPLNKVIIGEVRQQAVSRLRAWQNLLTASGKGQTTTCSVPVNAKVLLGTPELAARIYLSLDSYDYFLDNKTLNSKQAVARQAVTYLSSIRTSPDILQPV